VQIFRHLSDRCCYPGGAVVTIGTFDGLHLGHQALIHETVKIAQSNGLSSVVVFFDPHPAEFFAKELAPPRISNFRDKVDLLRHLGVNAVLCLPFDTTLAHMDATLFIERLLTMLNMKHIVVGQDFCFGKNRGGNNALLESFSTAKAHSFFSSLNDPRFAFFSKSFAVLAPVGLLFPVFFYKRLTPIPHF
jgi:riboflavin kinase/FMN adenylyltransferase